MPEHDAERVTRFVVGIRHDHIFQVVLDCEPPHFFPSLFTHCGVVGLGNDGILVEA